MCLLNRTKHCGGDFVLNLVILYLFHNFVDSKSVVTTIATLTNSKNIENPSDVPNFVKNESAMMKDSSLTTVLPSHDLKSVIEVGVNSTQTNSTKSNYMADYKPLMFDSPEDIKTQQEWGGNCTLTHWNECKVLARWFGKYEDPKDGEIKEYLIDCKEEPVVCLTNSWTVTRCNLLCMGRCNVRSLAISRFSIILHVMQTPFWGRGKFSLNMTSMSVTVENVKRMHTDNNHIALAQSKVLDFAINF